MKLTEELLKEMEKKKELYGDGIIMPDGDYRLIQDGHLKTLMALLRADRCQFHHRNENDPCTAENLRSAFQPWDRL